MEAVCCKTPSYSKDDDDGGGVSISSWVSVCPKGLWKVQRKQTHESNQHITTHSDPVTSGSSRCCPRLGSVCRVRVRLKTNVDEAETAESVNQDGELSVKSDLLNTEGSGCQDSVLQVPLGDWTTLRLGEGQCDIIEACLEGMRAGDKWEVLLSPIANDCSGQQPSDKSLYLCITVELQTFTPGKESWEMSPAEKWEWVKSHKERGGLRFRSGDVWGATDSYSKALKLLICLHSHVQQEEEQEVEPEPVEQSNARCKKEEHLCSTLEFRTIKAELHSNMSLCQLKLNQPERAKESASKAAQLEPSAAKAWYRLGQACHMLNDLEEAKRAFRKLLELQAEFPAALKALKDIARKEKENNAELGLRLSKMFT
ncbi:FK506-binding protein-like [Gouania willdenowi]|uniref:FK506-binding protein-like n=1 Tax=Gouania willdenowi TaxID=441366 RepID=A0A8C5D9A3_GOUWI|nr:FK506-binding protein-like [Gouania willdenowi]